MARAESTQRTGVARAGRRAAEVGGIVRRRRAALLARRELFQRVGLFKPSLRYGDAMDWFVRAAERGAVSELLPDALLYHRVHQSNLSRLEATASRNEFLHILKCTLDRRRSFDPAG